MRPATRAGSRADDQVQGQQAALPSEVRISRRRQDVRGNAIPDRQSLEVDRGNYEVGRRNFMAWSIWTILHPCICRSLAHPNGPLRPFKLVMQ